MATTKIWKIKGSIDSVISYVENPEKTRNLNFTSSDLQALRDVMDYAKNDYKTEKQYYVSGINCNPEYAREQMIATKKLYGKTGGIVAFHSYQSFVEGEVTADLAHKIGCELAKRVWGDRFEVVVATHLNTNHYHNHFVINSVSFVDGKKYYDNRNSYYNVLRKTSDEICSEYNLHVIKDPRRGRSKNYGENLAEKEGRPTLRGYIRDDIDKAIMQSNTKDQFFRAMEEMGYIFNFTPNRKYPTLKKKGAQRSVRFCSLGKGYDVEDILERIYSKSAKRYPKPVKKLNYYHYFGKAERKGKLKGFQRIYVRYMFLMGVLPKGNPIKPSHPLIREAVIHMRKIQQEYKLLTRNRIATGEQLLYFKKNREERLKLLCQQRAENTRLIRTEKNENKLMLLRRKGKELTKEISELRWEIRQCDSILSRSEKMKQDMEQVKRDEKIDVKEDKQYEHIRRSR